eukprot:scaffold1600_cov179-Amphora_coffeaeformis.AAC.10
MTTSSLTGLTPCQSSDTGNSHPFTLHEHLQAAASMGLAPRPRAQPRLPFVTQRPRGPCSRQELSDIIDEALSLMDDDDFMVEEFSIKHSDDSSSSSQQHRGSLQ